MRKILPILLIFCFLLSSCVPPFATKEYSIDEINQLYGTGKLPEGGEEGWEFISDLALYNALLKYNRLYVTDYFISYDKIKDFGEFNSFSYASRNQYSYYLNCPNCDDKSHNLEVSVYHNPSEHPPLEYVTEKSGNDLLTWEGMEPGSSIYYQIVPNVYLFYSGGKFMHAYIFTGQPFISVSPSNAYLSNCADESKYFNEDTAADAWNGLYHAIFELRDE